MSHDLVDDTRVSETSESQGRAPDLRLLGTNYEVIGELRGTATTRYFFGRRRDDGREVLIAVNDGVTENNALGHLASDTQLLESHDHPTVARVLDGRWLGANAYAVISERLVGPTLHELLSASGPLPNPRIATLLQEVHAALSWARDIGVVHRGVTPESVYIDPESRRPRVVLSLTPIPLEGLPDAASDARTIGALAWAMLTGSPRAEETPPLRELAPELASRVIDETTAMVSLSRGDEVPDVERFLSTIAMGDVLREGELEIARLQAELRERAEAETARNEARLREIEERSAALEHQLAQERAEFEETRREVEERLASDREQFAAERAQFEQERSEFSDRVAEFELRAAIERPADPITVLPPLASARAEEELVGSQGRLTWLLPVGTVALLIMLIVFGSLFARHRPPSQTVIFGRGRGAVPMEAPQAVIPRGGFLSQSAGSIAPRIGTRSTGDSAARSDSAGRRDSSGTDSAARHDSTRRRDSTSRRDTLARPDTTR